MPTGLVPEFGEPVSCAAIIAGGRSRRMGTPKALLCYEGEFLIARVAKILAPLFDEVVVVASVEAFAKAANVPSIDDIFPNCGPLGGIHAALSFFGKPTFCVACDMPFLRADVIGKFREAFHDCDALAPRVQGRMEPLHAIYAPTCLPTIEAALASGKVGSVNRVLAPLRIEYFDEEALRAFGDDLKFLRNINTPEDATDAGIATYRRDSSRLR